MNNEQLLRKISTATFCRRGLISIAGILVVLWGILFPVPLPGDSGGIALAQSPPPQGQDFIVEAEVDNPTPYVGQQIVYTFRIYHVNRFSYKPNYEPPSLTNFWSTPLPSQPGYKATVNGQEYTVTEIRTALFPTSQGRLTIAPTQFVAVGTVLNPEATLDTNPVLVEVQPLPDGAPPDFNGAVGQFKISAHLDRAQGRVDEPWTLVVEIKGEGNVETLAEPSLPALPGWLFFDSQSSLTTTAKANLVAGTRRFERLIVPGRAGDFVLPPIRFSYFNPYAQAYNSISTDPIPITVRPGEAAPLPVAPPSGFKQKVAVGADIRHIKPAPASFGSANSLILRRPLYWGVWLLATSVVGGLWFWTRRRRWRLSNIPAARSRRARHEAQRLLARAGQSGTDRYVAVQRALVGYLSDKLDRPLTGLTTDDLITLLADARMPSILIDRVRAVLERTDVGRFAPTGNGAASARTLLAETQTLIDDLDRSFENS